MSFKQFMALVGFVGTGIHMYQNWETVWLPMIRKIDSRLQQPQKRRTRRGRGL